MSLAGQPQASRAGRRPARYDRTCSSGRALRSAKFTADGNPSLAVDAGLAADRFFLATGGATTNRCAPLWSTVSLPESQPLKLPSDLPAF